MSLSIDLSFAFPVKEFYNELELTAYKDRLQELIFDYDSIKPAWTPVVSKGDLSADLKSYMVARFNRNRYPRSEAGPTGTRVSSGIREFLFEAYVYLGGTNSKPTEPQMKSFFEVDVPARVYGANSSLYFNEIIDRIKERVCLKNLIEKPVKHVRPFTFDGDAYVYNMLPVNGDLTSVETDVNLLLDACKLKYESAFAEICVIKGLNPSHTVPNDSIEENFIHKINHRSHRFRLTKSEHYIKELTIKFKAEITNDDQDEDEAEVNEVNEVDEVNEVNEVRTVTNSSPNARKKPSTGDIKFGRTVNVKYGESVTLTYIQEVNVPLNRVLKLDFGNATIELSEEEAIVDYNPLRTTGVNLVESERIRLNKLLEEERAKVVLAEQQAIISRAELERKIMTLQGELASALKLEQTNRLKEQLERTQRDSKLKLEAMEEELKKSKKLNDKLNKRLARKEMPKVKEYGDYLGMDDTEPAPLIMKQVSIAPSKEIDYGDYLDIDETDKQMIMPPIQASKPAPKPAIQPKKKSRKTYKFKDGDVVYIERMITVKYDPQVNGIPDYNEYYIDKEDKFSMNLLSDFKKYLDYKLSVNEEPMYFNGFSDRTSTIMYNMYKEKYLA